VAATDKLRASLATACGLLGVAGVKAQATEVQSGVLGYHEPGRVSAVELLSDVKHEFAGGQVGTIRLVYDALTGSSASGAVPALQKTQTFTSPSGNGSYSTEPGMTPLDNTFHDTRVAVSGGFSLPWGRLTTASLGPVRLVRARLHLAGRQRFAGPRVQPQEHHGDAARRAVRGHHQPRGRRAHGDGRHAGAGAGRGR
jgi:hypothetical protein